MAGIVFNPANVAGTCNALNRECIAMGRRDRLERKLEKRQEWIESRQRKAAERRHVRDNTPLPPGGEPIKTGHHSEKRHRAALEKVHNAAFKAIEHEKMADHHANKAHGLQEQLDGSIFSDDDDAVEQLQARIDEREAERDRIKKYNASCRKGKPDLSILDDKQKRDILSIARHCSYQLGKTGQFPAYTLQNLGANIRRDKQRIEQIKRLANKQKRAEEAGGVMIGEPCQYGYIAVTFAEYPGRPIIKTLKAAGFYWGGGSWTGKADNLPEEVRTMAEGGAS